MDTWPIDSRTKETNYFEPKPRGPRKARPEPNWNAPLLDVGTFSSSRLLTQKIGACCLIWDNINSINGPSKRLSTGNARCIFPPTREESRREARIPLDHKVIFTNKWLRNYKSMQDLDAITLRTMIKDDEKYRQSSMEYDPYTSNTMSLGFFSSGHKKRAGVLVYPMGRSFESLGACLLVDEKWGTVAVPSEQPIWVAKNPILQIKPSRSIYKPSTENYTDAGCLFAVRTLFDVDIVRIRPKPGVAEPTKLKPLASINSKDIGGRRPFDVAFDSDQTSNSLVVSDVGAVWYNESGSPSTMLFSSAEDDSSRVGAYGLPYWGIDWASHPQTFILGSQSALRLCDRRAPGVASTFNAHGDTLTCFDTLRDADYMQIFSSDTRRVMLLDERMFTRPIVTWNHYRTHDKTLRVSALKIKDKCVALLHSGRSHLVSVYDPSLDQGGRLTKCDSYCLEFGSTGGSPTTSIAVYVPPHRSQISASTVFRLTDRGAIYRQDLTVGTCEPTGEEEIWAHELQRLASRVPLEGTNYEHESLVEHTDESLRNDYVSIYRNDQLDLGRVPSITDILDLTPSVMERAEEPIDKIMTLHDIIRVISQESNETSSRTHFATGLSLPLPNARSLLDLVTRLHSDTRGSVSWSHDLSETQRRLAPSLIPTPDPAELLVHSTHQATSHEEDDGSNEVISGDKPAREEIALDLALAMTTYSSLSFEPSQPRLPAASTTCDEDDMLSVAASALTLEETEPPHLTHIQPYPTQGLIDGKAGAEQRQSMAVRLLASEWDPDSSVQDYVFFDPYSQDNDSSMPAWKLSAQTKADRGNMERARFVFPARASARSASNKLPLPSAQILRPEASAINTKAKGSGLGGNRLERTMSSQPREAERSQMAGSSQMPSTQVLAGPFGGRLSKQKKTRLAGF